MTLFKIKTTGAVIYHTAAENPGQALSLVRAEEMQALEDEAEVNEALEGVIPQVVTQVEAERLLCAEDDIGNLWAYYLTIEEPQVLCCSEWD